MFFNTELFPFFFSHHRRTCRGRRYWSVCGFWKQEDYGNLRYSGKIPAQSQAALDRTLHASGYSIGMMIRNILTWFFFLSNHVTCRIHRENHSLRSKRYYSPLLRRPLAGWTVFFSASLTDLKPHVLIPGHLSTNGQSFCHIHSCFTLCTADA